MSDFSIAGCGKGHIPQEPKAAGKDVKAQTTGQQDIQGEPPQPLLCDMSKIDTGIRGGIGKIGKINPDKFKDLFQDQDVSQAKSLIKEMIAIPAKDKGGLADKVRDFFETTGKMDNHELVEVAKHINELMKNTDGNDDLLGSLLKGVLEKLDNSSSSTGHPGIGGPERPFPNQKPEPGHVWDEKLPDIFKDPFIREPQIKNPFMDKLNKEPVYMDTLPIELKDPTRNIADNKKV